MTAAKKGDNKEHITGNNAGTGDTSSTHEPIKGEDGRMDFTKSGKAYQIFDEMHNKDANIARKDCLERAMKEADMTYASAATFYQKWRSDRGLVGHEQAENSQEHHKGDGKPAAKK